MMKILIVRMSALGDIVHALPAITDVRKAWPQARIDVAVDERFADIPRLHAAVDQVIPIPLRYWKRSWRSRAGWRSLLATLATLRAERYDLVIDLHGLIKSATVTALARSRHKVGFGRLHCSEWMAPLAYRRHFSIPDAPTPVARMRGLVAFALGSPVCGPDDYGLACQWQGWSSRQVALIHIASNPEKCWPEERWAELGRRLVAAGYEPVLPWGCPEEEARARRLAEAIDPQRCNVGPRQTIATWAQQLAGCRMVIGQDTGLTHLATAAGVPCLALFLATSACLLAPQVVQRTRALGGDGRIPALDEVVEASLAMLGENCPGFAGDTWIQPGQMPSVQAA